MKRLLTQVIIFSMLVIAPVSFSTEKIPNFDVPATENTLSSESRKTTVLVAHRSVTSACKIIHVSRPLTSFALIVEVPAFNIALENLHDRSPPTAVPST